VPFVTTYAPIGREPGGGLMIVAIAGTATLRASVTSAADAL
jgi:hypothetical protein